MVQAERQCCIAAESMNSPHECECDLSMSSSRNVILQGWASSSIPPSSKQTKPTKVLESEACGARALPQELATGPAAAGRGHGDWMRGAGWLGGWARFSIRAAVRHLLVGRCLSEKKKEKTAEHNSHCVPTRSSD